MNPEKQAALAGITGKSAYYNELSDTIFDAPETAFMEATAAQLLCEALRQNGFGVTRGVAGMDTAFCGRFGKGGPVIGILGEYDALSGVSQVPGIAERHELKPGANGHGCGHNLLGVGALAAAVAVKEYLVATGMPGTVIYYGCPGEEGGSGKAFMARDGVFDELDCALTWHPGTLNIVPPSSSLANYQVAFRFRGVSAHAAGAPHLGRSALDGVELMNTGIQYLREHMPDAARIHYAITNAGGNSPNVVQPEAEVLYLIRAPKISQVKDLYRRVVKVAEGAAMMTETELDIDFSKACYNLVPNDTLAGALQSNMLAVGAPTFTEAEQAYAQALNDTLGPKGERLLDTVIAMAGEQGRALAAYRAKPLYDFVLPYMPVKHCLPSSTDVGDVSWICPTAQLSAVTMASGTPGHSWQLTAQGKSGQAHKGMAFAGQVIAGAAIDILNDPAMLEKAKEEHNGRLGTERYVPVIPPKTKPRAASFTE